MARGARKRSPWGSLPESHAPNLNRLRDELVGVGLLVDGLRLVHRCPQRGEHVLDAAARANVGALLHQAAHKLAAELTEHGLHEG